MIRLAALALVLSVTGAAAQTTFDGGWWVVVASFSNPATNAQNDASIGRVRSSLRSCGVASFNDWSMKFKGFQPGYDVVVVGSYRDRQTADRALAKVRPCAPPAYVKAGRYLGE